MIENRDFHLKFYPNQFLEKKFGGLFFLCDEFLCGGILPTEGPFFVKMGPVLQSFEKLWPNVPKVLAFFNWLILL